MIAEHADKRARKVHASAPAGVAYALMADAPNWPLYFSSIIHVEQLEFDGVRERLLTWTLLDDQIKAWTSQRRLDPVARRMEFWQEIAAPPFRTAGGVLSAHPDGPHDSELELRYDYSVGADSPADLEWAQRATETHARAQLADLKAFAERWTRLDELVLSFEDTVHIKGPAELVYDFLYRAGDWPDLVPHVQQVDLTESVPGVQHLTMRTLTEYGTHTTSSVRICFPHAERIVYKQTAPLPLIEAHTGEWSVVPDERGVTVTAQHNVVLSEEQIAGELGEQATLADARRHVREALGRNSRVLLAHAKTHAESAVRML
ncbi:cyclase [Streptomyces sp. Act143]|uniref:aromatase/cyclase n=1 Tax=Streptomyces sp. Act143 TaxID=2200760 RepID=UPI000D682669|nr:aromatase/cyclase [Streptomyces sp. Act143]PWI15247.1 cyclase [Streptomyces sp. Act143]